jgi:light-regulated signal transduction histidine kinase (bacteriophytochrome)
VVTGYLDLIARRYQGKLDEKADIFIHFAVDAVKRMDTLITELLNYSRLATSDASFTSVDTNQVFEEAVSNLDVAISDSGAVITRDDLPTLTGAHTLLVQLFQNLLGNAVKFTKPGIAPEIHVSIAKKQRQWVFAVRDKGIGIEPKYFERIFAIFQRLHTREEFAGTGIGLAMCKRIIERHHGRMWLESTPGEGATFFFSLPAGDKSQPEEPSKARSSRTAESHEI